jgi:hypothetical protein
MFLRFVYLLLRRLVDVFGRRLCSRLENEVEIAILRHELEVLTAEERHGGAPSHGPRGSVPSHRYKLGLSRFR